MLKIPFQTTLLLGPLAYAIHHGEENLLLDFRSWRLSYFADNNSLTTEAVFVIITGITLVYILCYHVFKTREALWMVMTFFMASQVVNAFFHLGGTIVFRDFSPGLITGILLYLPVNILICRAALREDLVSHLQLGIFFVAGATLFTLFEIFGPFPLLVFVGVTWAWIGISARNVPSLPRQNQTMIGNRP